MQLSVKLIIFVWYIIWPENTQQLDPCTNSACHSFCLFVECRWIQVKPNHKQLLIPMKFDISFRAIKVLVRDFFVMLWCRLMTNLTQLWYWRCKHRYNQVLIIPVQTNFFKTFFPCSHISFVCRRGLGDERRPGTDAEVIFRMAVDGTAYIFLPVA